MKREGYLWQRLISFENLLAAAEKACKGKRFRAPVAAFHFDLERQLWRLHRELADKTYRPGAYRTFFIHEPKPRQISAAPYRDRIGINERDGDSGRTQSIADGTADAARADDVNCIHARSP